jgi:hypothetical protein
MAELAHLATPTPDRDDLEEVNHRAERRDQTVASDETQSSDSPGGSGSRLSGKRQRPMALAAVAPNALRAGVTDPGLGHTT